MDHGILYSLFGILAGSVNRLFVTRQVLVPVFHAIRRCAVVRHLSFVTLRLCRCRLIVHNRMSASEGYVTTSAAPEGPDGNTQPMANHQNPILFRARPQAPIATPQPNRSLTHPAIA